MNVYAVNITLRGNVELKEMRLTEDEVHTLYKAMDTGDRFQHRRLGGVVTTFSGAEILIIDATPITSGGIR